MRILITGGAGYLGSIMVGRLLDAGHAVTVVDTLMYGVPSLIGYASRAGFDFVRGDARDEGTMRDLLARHDAIIPLAAIVGMKACINDPIGATTVNLGAIKLLNRLRSRDQIVVSPCTNSGYGTKSGDVFCTEETPLDPVSLYGQTKVQAEAELLSSPNALSLRLATVFGPSPRMRLDLLVNDFVYRAVFDGFLVIYEKNFKRNYVHIEDVADAFVYCLSHFDTMKGQAYNFGLNDANLSKAELADAIKARVPSLYVHYAEVGQDPDRRNYIVSNEKINRAGVTAIRSIDEGISQLLLLYRMLPKGYGRNA